MKPSIVVGTASGRDPKWQYTYDIVKLISGLGQLCERAAYQVELGYATDFARNKLARMAITEGFTHLLFIDDDMSFPGDSIHRLLAHDKDIIAANYVRRQFPVSPVSQKDDHFVFSRNKTGLEEVDHAGTGLMLIKAEVFKKLPEPWFYSRLENNDLVSDDVHFCRMARAHGLKVWVDHDLSQDVGHVGDFTYHHGLTAPPQESKDLVTLCKEQLA